jgi:hypothetical protein
MITGQAYPLEQTADALGVVGAISYALDAQGLGHDVSNAHAWVERRKGILKDYLHFPPQVLELLAFDLHEVDEFVLFSISDAAGGRLD